MGDKATDRGPVGDAYRRVAAALRGSDIGPVDFDIVFDIPGSMHTPKYSGIKVGRVAPNEGRIQVWIALPADIPDADLEVEMIGLAESAIAAGADKLARAGVAIEPDALKRVAMGARLELGFADFGTGDKQAIVGDAPNSDGSNIEVRVLLSTDSDRMEQVASILALGERIDARLRGAGWGDLEGNEVDGDSVTLFVSSTIANAEAVVALLEEILPAAVSTVSVR